MCFYTPDNMDGKVEQAALDVLCVWANMGDNNIQHHNIHDGQANCSVPKLVIVTRCDAVVLVQVYICIDSQFSVYEQ